MNKLIKYINHQGDKIVFGEESFHYFENELRNYSWDYSERNGRISAFSKPIQERKFPVGIAAESEEEGLYLRDHLYEVADVDVIAGKPGKLVIGDWALECYIVASNADMYWLDDRFAEFELTILAEDPYWTKRTLFMYRFDDPTLDIEGIVMTPQETDGVLSDDGSDFPFNFTASSSFRRFFNNAIAPCDFLLRVYGSASAPLVNIAGNTYETDIVVPSGSRLEIDSMKKTIVVIDSVGRKTNAFNARKVGREGSGSYIFEKIPTGRCNIWTNKNFKVDIEIIERRSTPTWLS